MEAATHPHDHNQPPTVFDEIKARVDELIPTANKWIAERPEITDRATAEKGDVFLSQLLAEVKAAETERKKEKEPILESGKACDKKWNDLKVLPQTAYDALKPRIDKFLVAEQKKLDAERAAAAAAAAEAERLAEEARKAAEAPTATVEERVEAEALLQAAAEAVETVQALPAKAAVKGAFSSKARTLTTRWHARMTNYAAAALHYRDHTEVREVLERLASAEARGGVRKLPGFDIYSEES